MVASKKLTLVADSIYYGIGQAAQRAIALIALPFFLKFIDPSDYGVVGLLVSLSVFVLPVFSVGLTSSIGVCYFNEKINYRENVISSAILLSMISASILILLTIFFINEITELLFLDYKYKSYTLVALITIAFSILCIPAQLQQQFTKQSATFLNYSLKSAFISLLFSFIFIVFLNQGALGLLIGSLVGQIALWFMLFFKSYKTFCLIKIKSFINIKDLMKFGIPMIPSFFLLFIIQNSMRWSLQSMDSLSAVGIFSLGASIGAIFNIIASGITAAWLPYALGQEAKWSELRFNFGNNLKIYFMFGSFLVALFFIFAQPILKIIAPNFYFEAWEVVGLVAASHFFISIWNMTLPPLYMEKRIRLIMLAQLFAAAITILSIYLLSDYGVLGAGLTSVIGSISLLLAQNFINYNMLKTLPIPFKYSEYVNTFIVISLISILSFALSIERVIEFYIGISFLLIFLLIYFFQFNKKNFKQIKFFLNEQKSLFTNKQLNKTNSSNKNLKDKNFLILYDEFSTHTDTVYEHLDSFRKYSKFKIHYLHAKNCSPRIHWEFYDGLIIHYSLRVAHKGITKKLYSQIKEFPGLKIMFVQDEYENTNVVIDAVNKLKINFLYTCVPKKYIRNIYPKDELLNTVFVPTLTGYTKEIKELAKISLTPIKSRKNVIGYRGNDLPFYYGDLGQEKKLIAILVKEECLKRSVNFDIAYDTFSRIYGKNWTEFLQNSKATLGTESGSNIFDFDGSIKRKFLQYKKKYPNATYNETKSKISVDFREDVIMNQISPRIFEAIMNKTALVLFEGAYSNILIPNRHYILLRKDLSNVNDVFKKLSSDKYLQKLVDRTFIDILGENKYSYKKFINNFDKTIFSIKTFNNITKNYLNEDSSLYLDLIYFSSKKPTNVPNKIPIIHISNKYISFIFNKSKIFFPDEFKIIVKKLILKIHSTYS